MNIPKLTAFFESRTPEQAGIELRDSYFGHYYATVFGRSNFQWFEKDVAAFCEQAVNHRGRVLDLACGFGVMTLCLCDFFEEVVGLEFFPQRLITATRLQHLLGLTPVNFVSGRGQTLPFEDSAFDTIVIRHGMEHLYEPERVLAEAYRTLRRGGLLVMKEGNNALHLPTRRKVRATYEETEVGCSPFRPQNYTQMRYAILREVASYLSDKRAWHLAQRTRGYTRHDLIRMLDAEKQGRKFMFRREHNCINPDLLIVQEQLLNPFAVARMLNSVGFHAEILPPTHYGQPTKSAVRRLKR